MRIKPTWIAVSAATGRDGSLYIIYSPPPEGEATSRPWYDLLAQLSGGQLHNLPLPAGFYSLIFDGSIAGRPVVLGAPGMRESEINHWSLIPLSAGTKKDLSPTGDLGELENGKHCIAGEQGSGVALYAVDGFGRAKSPFLTIEALEKAASGLIDASELDASCAHFAGRDLVMLSGGPRSIFMVEQGRARLIGAGTILGAGERHILIEIDRAPVYFEAWR